MPRLSFSPFVYLLTVDKVMRYQCFTCYAEIIDLSCTFPFGCRTKPASLHTPFQHQFWSWVCSSSHWMSVLHYAILKHHRWVQFL